MAIRVGIEAAPLNEPGMWTAQVEAAELRHFGRPLTSQGSRTIIGITAPEYRDGSLMFSPADAVLLNAGRSDQALIVELDDDDTDMSESSAVIRIDGDDGFRAAASALFCSEMAGTAHDLLDAIRREFPGHLVVGQGRKWVNSPANFVALTIQNRDQSLAITVRGEPDRHPNTPLQLKRDRPGYSRFKISAPNEVERAMMHIRRAAHLYQGGRGSEPLER